MKKSVPDRDAPMVDEQGRITPPWLEYFKDLDARALREKVSATSPANNQVLVFNSTSGLWAPRNTLTKPVSATEPNNGEVLIYNSGTGLYTPGAN